MKNIKVLLSFLLLLTCFNMNGQNHRTEIDHVILIGLDGWGSYSIAQAVMPHARSLADNGAYTYDSWCVLPSSSAVNWSTMFFGAGPELHGYTSWDSKEPALEPKELDKYGKFPSIFTLLYEQRPGSKIVAMYEWGGIEYLFPARTMHSYENIKAVDNSSRPLAEAAISTLVNIKPNLMLVIFDEPDGVGHKYGHDTDEYYAKLKELDGYIGEIINAVDEAGMADRTVIIVTSDHGGINKGHGGNTLRERAIPLIINGPGIKKGHRITSSVMQYDTAATIARILDLQQPQIWTGRAIGEIFD